jgi:hypothetical protein
MPWSLFVSSSLLLLGVRVMGIRHYAGIGSRSTPPEFLALMTRVAAYLKTQNFTLRSGAAQGADSAFEAGADTQAEIFLPWQGYNGKVSGYPAPELNATLHAAQFHPAWDRLPNSVRMLMARNSYQVLGFNLADPVAFVICWTPGGRGEGGTGQALRIAHHHSIPVFDMGRYQTIAECRKALAAFFVPFH